MTAKNTVYEFADLRLDVGKELLMRAGCPIQLQGKSFELLSILVRSEGRLISRDELMELLWPGTFVEENNLSQHIRAIRKSLGDGENGTRFVETVPRRGIRFLPDVRVLDDAGTGSVGTPLPTDPTLSDATTDRSRLPNRISRWIILGTAFAGLALSIYLGFVYFGGSTKKDDERISYANNIRLAQQALNFSNLTLAKQLLDETKPRPGEEDVRGFEWGYLSNVLAEASASQPTLLAHESGVDAAAFSPDGKTLATAAFDNVVRTWDLNSGSEVRSFSGHTKLITFVAFSPDGGRLLTTGFDQTARVWDVATGQELYRIHDPIAAAQFSIDGSAIISVRGREIIFWDAATGTEKSRFAIPVEAGALRFSPDAKLLAVRGHDQTIHILDASRKKSISIIEGHSGWIMDFQFSPDSNLLVTASKDRTAKLWDVRSGKELLTFKGHDDELYEVEFSPDGTTIATGSNDQTTRLWDVAKGFEITRLRSHTGNVTALAYSADGRKLASGGVEGMVRVWNASGLRQRGVLRGHTESVTRVMFSPTGRMLVSSSKDKTARVWDVESGLERIALGGHTDTVHTAIFSSDGDQIATVSEDKTIKLWDPKTGRELLSIDSPIPATNLAMSPDGKVLVTGHWFHDPMLRFWDVASGELTCSVKAHKAGPWSMEFFGDGTRVVTAAIDESSIVVWDSSTCEKISTYEGEADTGYGVSFGPDNKLRALQILNGGRSLKLVDIETGTDRASFSGDDAILADAVFSPDGSRLVTSDERGILRIWDTATGQELLSFSASSGDSRLAFSPDGTILAIGDTDGTIKLLRTLNAGP